MDIAVIRNESHSKYMLYVLMVFYVLSMLQYFDPGFRYLKYLPFPILSFLWFFENKNYTLRPKAYLYPFIWLLLGGMISFYRINVLGLKDLFFILNAMIFFLLFRDVKVNVRKLNLFFIIFWLCINLATVSGDFNFSFIMSESPFEGTESFVFGLFAIFFMLEKNKVFALLNVLLLVVTLKRIAILAFILVLICSLLPVRYRRRVLGLRPILFLNIFMLFLIYLFACGVFNDFIYKQFGINAYHLSMGRLYVLQDVVGVLKSNWQSFIFYGLGAGAAYDFASKHFGEDANLHCDILKIILEFGLIWFIGFITIMYRFASERTRYFVLYFNVILYTDNIIIYGFVLVFYFLLISQVRYCEN